MRPLALLAVLTAAAGCQFDATVSSRAVRCDDGRCPTGFVCRARLGLCVPDTASSSVEAPRLLTASVAPARAKHGDVLRVQLSASRALFAPPRVSLLEPDGPRTLQLASQVDQDFTFSYAVDAAGDVEGSHALTADLVDTTGAEAVAQPVGSVTLDFTPPRVLDSVFAAPRAASADGGLTVRPHELLAVRLSLSEAVQATADLAVASSCDAGASFTLRSAQGSQLDFSGAAPAASGCRFTLSLQGLQDLAGNATAATALPLHFEVDGTPPVVSDLRVLRVSDGGAVPASTFSLQPGFDTYLLRFASPEAAAAVEVRFDRTPVTTCACAAGACECQGTARAADGEGVHVLSVTATDVAGNSVSDAAQVRFDFTAPRLLPGASAASITPPPGCPLSGVSALGSGAVARLELSLDEPGTASVRSVPSGLELMPEASTPTHFAFRGAADGGTPQGSLTLRVDAVDEVGNQASLPFGTLDVDTLAPSPPDTASAEGVTLRRTPWGTRDAGPSLSVTVLAGATGGATAVQVLDDATPLGTAPLLDGGCSLTLAVADRPVVSVRAIDAACNRSPAVVVRNVEWLASLEGKRVGSAYENPHRLEARAVQGSVTTQPGAVEVAPRTGLTQAGAAAWSRPGRWPGVRVAPALAYDSARGVLVLFGGEIAGDVSDELWEWSSATGGWTNRTPAARPAQWPAPRGYSAATFDSTRNRVVVFGGWPRNDEVWEWDGVAGAWSNRTPSPRPSVWPPAGGEATFTFDPRRGKAVLFGGAQATSTELWEWDGLTGRWALRQPASSTAPRPPALDAPVLAYDERRDVVVLFGGDARVAGYRRLWEWNGTTATWTDRTPATLPPAWPNANLYAGGMVSDPLRGRLVLYAGYGNGDELWEWDGATGTWTNRTPSPRPTAWPIDRYAFGFVYDTVRGAPLAYGGWANNSNDRSDELWEWRGDSATWLNHTPARRPVPWPAGVAPALTYDSDRHRVVAFGGFTVADELWEWDGVSATWTNRTPTPRPTAWPVGRAWHSITYDPGRRRVVLFGGLSQAPAYQDELWEWDGAAGTWANRTPSPRPTAWPRARTYHGQFFDPPTGRVVVFGGHRTQLLDELWAWDGASGTWTDLTPSPRPASWPSARFAFGIAFDTSRRKAFLSGGVTSDYLDELWEWDAASATWTNRTPTPRPVAWPSARADMALAYDSTRDRVMGFGGDVGGRELWQLEPTTATWAGLASDLEATSWPAAFAGKSMLYDPERRKLVLVEGAQSDVWEYGTDVANRPGLVAQFSFAVAGAGSGAQVTSVAARAVAGASSGAAGDAGVTLRVSTSDYLATETSAAWSDAAPGPIDWQASSPARLATLFEGPAQRVSLAFTPTGLNAAARPAVVRLDWVELAVRYRLP